MMVFFYIFGIITILSTVFVILHYHPVRALLYLIVSFLSISCNFFCLGASFAGASEVIVYAGAIMILFIFVLMMLNTKTIMSVSIQKEDLFVNSILGCGVILLIGILFIILLCISFESKDYFIHLHDSEIDSKKVGMTLFGPYLLVVELASFLLLGALISVFHLAQECELATTDCIVSNQSKEYKK